MNSINRILSEILCSQLKAAGFLEKRSTGEIEPLYSEWLEHSLKLLEQYQLIERKESGGFQTTQAYRKSAHEIWNEWEVIKKNTASDRNIRSHIILLDKTLKAIPEILTGQVSATEIVFPQSGFDLVKGLYGENDISDYYNEILATSVLSCVKNYIKKDPSKQVRILELGAGTGSSSSSIFKKLSAVQQHIQTYCYTDISTSFLDYGKKNYGEQYPYLVFDILNIEKKISQSVAADSYDIVLATNVLHATKDIRQTLGNIKAILRKNGILIINEVIVNTLFTHLTFGLLEGWWLFEDADLRIPGSPILSAESWKRILEEEGFTGTYSPLEEAKKYGQQVFLAISDGNLKQQAVVEQKSPGTQFKSRLSSNVEEKMEATQFTNQYLYDSVTETIINALASLLKIPKNEINNNDSFSDYGLDSLSAIQLIQAINTTYGLRLKTSVIFDNSSVNKLKIFLTENFKQNITSSLPSNLDTKGNTNNFRQVIAPETPQHENRNHKMPVREPIQHLNGKDKSSQEPIAIIGMSGRFAKSNSPDELWKHLESGTSLIEKVTRWDISNDYPERENFCNYGALLDDIDKFDPFFFKISSIDAAYMDPQQRFFLEESWKALEDAGYAGNDIKGKQCGVYVGYNGCDYQHLILQNPPAQVLWGNSASVIPARIAYYLDLHGPAIAMDTACSSSLVAIHTACQSLWTKEIDMALAGGVFIQVTPGFYTIANRAGMLSPTGHCYAFDERANGFVPGEGVGVVVLKRLKDAINDHDHIYGVIKGSSINQDGTTNGLTAPSADSQERLETKVYDSFNINPANIQMVEAHGTGTKLGDPIEFTALSRTFKKYTDKTAFCAVGSIKTNLGHTASAAGVAGIIKVLLSLKNKQIPASLNYKKINPEIELSESPFYINARLKDWDIAPDQKRMAAVSSFGFSGTNAHIVIEEAPVIAGKPVEKPVYLIVLSARTAEQLIKQTQQLIAFCENDKHAPCSNISFTLMTGRRHFSHRLAAVVRNKTELITQLSKWVNDNKTAHVYSGELDENNVKQQTSLKRLGNDLIQACAHSIKDDVYIENITSLAELFVQGYELNFNGLFTSEDYYRVPLPTYPFRKDRYWIPEIRNNAIPAKTQQVTVSLPAIRQEQKEAVVPTKPGKVSIKLKPLHEIADIDKKDVQQKPNAIRLRIPDNSSVTEKSFSPSEPEDINNFSVVGVKRTIEKEPPKIPSHTTGSDNKSETEVKEYLRLSLAKALFMQPEEISFNKSFVDLGMDSIISVEWIKQVNDNYRISVTATKVYDYPNLKEFAAFIQKEIIKKSTAGIPENKANQNGYKKPVLPETLDNQNKISTKERVEDFTTVGIKSSKQITSKIERNEVKLTTHRFNEVSIQEDLKSTLAEALYMKAEDITINKQFVDLGMDSIISVEWIRTINNTYGVSIPATKVYDYPSIRNFSTFLLNEIIKLENKNSFIVPQQSSVEDIFKQVHDGNLSTEEANELINRLSN